jgi:hypothetical protein
METRAKLQSEMEPTEGRDILLKVLSEHEGKMLTKRISDKLEAAGLKEVRIRRQYGMAHIDWGSYGLKSPDRDNGSLLVAHSEKNVHIDMDYIMRQNSAYFSARDERNRAREKVVNSHLCERADAARAKFMAARAEMLSIIDEFSEEGLSVYERFFEIPDLQRYKSDF